MFLRVILYIYIHQYYDVRWNGKYSERFSVSNGIRQGGISSPIFWNLYLDRLIKRIRRLGFGCHVEGVFLGIFVYADDIFLLCPSRPGLQVMVKECQDFAKQNNLTFSTDADPSKSKTKCIIFNKKSIDTNRVKNITLDGKTLPWVKSLKHLGMTLEEDNSMSMDIAQKRGMFIGKIKSLQQEFCGTNSEVKMRIFQIYTLSFYGSSIYNLFSKEVNRIYTTYNKLVRTTFSVPRETHRYFIEELTKTPHIKVLHCSRLIKFQQMLLKSERRAINFIAKMNSCDTRTTHGN